LNMAVMVSVLPMPIRSRQLQKATTSHTALIGVCVREFTLLQKLLCVNEKHTWYLDRGSLTLRREMLHLARRPMPFLRLPAWLSIR
jgi:hypothetical protein